MAALKREVDDGESTLALRLRLRVSDLVPLPFLRDFDAQRETLVIDKLLFSANLLDDERVEHLEARLVGLIKS